MPEPDHAASQLAELEQRHAALQQAATLPGADLRAVLDAAFAELEGAIATLGTAFQVTAGQPAGKTTSAASAERRLLRAAFSDAPVPLFLLARDGTVLRVNKSAGQLLGAQPGYATGRVFTAFVTLPARAAVQTQLTAVARSGKARRMRCSLLGPHGDVASELVFGLVRVTGDEDQLVVAAASAVRDDGSAAGAPAVRDDAEGAGSGGSAGVVEAITQRMDLVTAVTRLLLENENFSETLTLQRCARLLAGELAAWVIVDMERRERLRRQFVIGPDGADFAAVTEAVVALNPTAGSLPQLVHRSGQSVLIAHADDADVLGPGPADVPVLMMLGATSVLSVPLADGEDRYGVLTMARRPGEGHFEIADLGLVEELGEQLALAIRVDHMFRRRTQIADALQASLLPRRLPEIPGAELAVAYVNATEGVEVGADFYDAYRIPAGWGLSVGDVCGKGEEAAAVTAAARHAIRVIAHGNADPGRVLATANEILLAEELNGGFVTACAAHLAWQDGVLRVVIGSAGHPGPVIVRADGQVQLVAGGGLPLGLFPDAEPRVQEFVLAENDVLFLYTDGVTQARARDKIYFSERLSDELSALAGRQPEQIIAAMRTALLEFSDHKLVDDFSMVVLRAGPSPEPAKTPARNARSRRKVSPSS